MLKKGGKGGMKETERTRGGAARERRRVCVEGERARDGVDGMQRDRECEGTGWERDRECEGTGWERELELTEDLQRAGGRERRGEEEKGGGGGQDRRMEEQRATADGRGVEQWLLGTI